MTQGEPDESLRPASTRFGDPGPRRSEPRRRAVPRRTRRAARSLRVGPARRAADRVQLDARLAGRQPLPAAAARLRRSRGHRQADGPRRRLVLGPGAGELRHRRRARAAGGLRRGPHRGPTRELPLGAGAARVVRQPRPRPRARLHPGEPAGRRGRSAGPGSDPARRAAPGAAGGRPRPALPRRRRSDGPDLHRPDRLRRRRRRAAGPPRPGRRRPAPDRGRARRALSPDDRSAGSAGLPQGLEHRAG